MIPSIAKPAIMTGGGMFEKNPLIESPMLDPAGVGAGAAPPVVGVLPAVPPGVVTTPPAAAAAASAAARAACLRCWLAILPRYPKCPFTTLTFYP